MLSTIPAPLQNHTDPRPSLQGLRGIVEGKRAAAERGATALKEFGALLEAIARSADAVATGAEPGIIPELHHGAYTMPPLLLQRMSDADARAALAQVADDLASVAYVTNIASMRVLMSYVLRMSRIAHSPLAHGVLYMLLSPEDAKDEDELPPWAIGTQMYLSHLGVPSATLAHVRTGGHSLAMRTGPFAGSTCWLARSNTLLCCSHSSKPLQRVRAASCLASQGTVPAQYSRSKSHAHACRRPSFRCLCSRRTSPSTTLCRLCASTGHACTADCGGTWRTGSACTRTPQMQTKVRGCSGSSARWSGAMSSRRTGWDPAWCGLAAACARMVCDHCAWPLP